MTSENIYFSLDATWIFIFISKKKLHISHQADRKCAELKIDKTKQNRADMVYVILQFGPHEITN